MPLGSHTMITSKGYLGITDRSSQVDDVKRELQGIINSLPTQIHPDERAAFIDAILSDLSDKPSSPWVTWPSETYLLALTAVKTLSRNPIGSEGLYAEANYRIILFHSALPISPHNSSSSHPPPCPTSPQALEAMRILANLGVSHSLGRKRLADLGGSRAIARAFAGRDADGEENISEEDEENVDRLFLLARLGFVVTIDREDAVKIMVDQEGIIDHLVYFLINTSLAPGNFNAISDLLKFTNNIIRFYPFQNHSSQSTSSSSFDTSNWDDRFDNLLWATLVILHTMPFTDLAPPLSHCLHVLLSIPWTERLLSMWHSSPADPPSPSSGGMRGILNRLSNISNISGISSPSGSRKSSASEQGVATGSINVDENGNLAPPRLRTPSPSHSNRRRRRYTLPPRKEMPTAFAARVTRILETILDRWLPWPRGPDDKDFAGDVVMDEHLPPILLLLARGAEGSEPTRKYLKDLLFPANLDRSPEAGPLEKRRGLLGTLLRFMGCTNHPQCKNSAGELLWAVCGGDPSTFNAEIGYGNAAGLLFLKGIGGVPQGKIEEIEEGGQATANTSSKASVSPSQRHPITALENTADDVPSLSNMTDEEKEREAERLFDVFDKMDKNPVISTKGPDGKERGVKDALRATYLENERKFEEKEEEERREQEERDEEEALRDHRAYLARKGRKG